MLQVNLQDLRNPLKLRGHPGAQEDQAALGAPGARGVQGAQEAQEDPVDQAERPHLVQEKLPSKLNPQRNQEPLGVLVDQGDPVARGDRVAPVALGDQEDLRRRVLEKRQSQPNQQRSRVRQEVPVVPVAPVAPRDPEVPVDREVPVVQEDPEVPEDRVAREAPVVRQGPQPNLQEGQPRRPSQLRTPLGSPVARGDQRVPEGPEDPGARVDPEDPADQEDQEVTYQNMKRLNAEEHTT